MHKRTHDADLTEKRLLDKREACSYIGLGATSARPWLDKIGATRKFGKSVRFDREVIDSVLDRMREGR